MGQPFVGEIRMFGGNFAPAGWAFCSGQLMPISENEVLFNLIGTTYGGDGEETFALPDLQGRVPIHAGQGPGISQLINWARKPGLSRLRSPSINFQPTLTRCSLPTIPATRPARVEISWPTRSILFPISRRPAPCSSTRKRCSRLAAASRTTT